MKIRTPSKPPVTADAASLGSPQPLLAWTDFHTVLSVAQHGSVAKAHGAMGMTHSTLLRKLDLIETRLKARLFERSRGRYTLTAAGHEIVHAAQAFEPIAAATELRVRGHDLRPTGDVRVSVASVVIEHLLAPVLAQFGSAFPKIQIELTATRDHVSLRRREADVAIRIADTVPGWLVGRKLTTLKFKIYCHRRGHTGVATRSVEELVGDRRWIGFESDSRDLKFDRWLTDNVPDASVVLRVNNFSHAATMVRAGLGIALLPAFLEGTLPDLQPLTEPVKALDTPLWLITHPELKDTTRIRVVMRAFGPALANAIQIAQGDVQAT